MSEALAALCALVALTAIGFLPSADATPANGRPVVLELYTSLACSSCPPADALLGDIARSDQTVLPLSFNVTYWNTLGWPDPLGLQAATARQDYYASLDHSSQVYTPEAIVDGTARLVGSDRAGVLAAIAEARPAAAIAVPLTVSQSGPLVRVQVGAGEGRAVVWLFGYDPAQTTRVGGGENNGVTITEINVVRGIADAGSWAGTAEILTAPRPAGVHLAAVLQRSDGTILGATSE